MSEAEHQRALDQEAYRKKRNDFYKKHGRWPLDTEISETVAAVEHQQREPKHPLDSLFERLDI